MTEQKQDESKLDRVIRKIKRCMALSNSSNENEAATAMRQAHGSQQAKPSTDRQRSLRKAP